MTVSSVSGRHLPAETRLGTVQLRIADLSRSLEFYRDLLGLQVVAEESVSKSLAASPLGPPLLTLLEEPGALPHPPRTLGLYHLALRLPERRDLAQIVHRLLGERWRIQGASDHAVSEAIYLADPDENGLEIYVDRPSDLWRWEEGGIMMSTFPLDLPGLLLDFRDELEAWEGLPPETTVGHIHLHVSDLARAEAFYHDLLGFDVTTRAYPGALFFAAGGYHHQIGVNTWTGSGARAPAGTAGLIAYEIIIPDPVTLEEIHLNATRQDRAITPDGNGWQLEDQDGNLVMLRAR